MLEALDMALSPLLLLLLAIPALFLLAVAGGYGGARLRCREIARDLAEAGADLEGFDLRIKKLEGRKVREEQLAKRGNDPAGNPDMLAALAAAGIVGGPGVRRGPRAVPSEEESESEIIRRTFGSADRPAGSGG